MNFPLCLTLSRILLGPVFMAVVLYYPEMDITLKSLPYILLILACISEVSDVFDGFLARKHNKVTELGKLLDPMADSIFRLSVLFSFTQGFIHLPLLLVSVFFYRDIIISTLRTVCALRGVALAARWSGKIKAVILAIVIFFILILMIPYSLGYLDLETLQMLSFYSVSVAAIYVAYSGIEYINANKSYIKKALGL
ncbi:MAG: CDP-diacylglycerol--glycerol-3-phosphate 3-phosphatidyltransferase [Chlamydiae bacterium]|nr:CDP-diacylglycerol--glycerol-3-phosphate 3-phosphatidyltransferase [Chlamydiota bacterium]